MVHVYVASAFSKDNKGGNKAGVVLNRPELTPGQKMAIAKELGYSETAFVSESEVADFKLEYFTPTEEVPLCGHATIATFSVLYLLGKLQKKDYTFEAKAGILRIQVEEDGMIFMEQNQPVFYEMLDWGEVNKCMDRDTESTFMPIQMVSTGLKDIIQPVGSVKLLGEMNPNFEKISELSKKYDAIGIHAFALAEDKNVTAVCRNFAPLVGIDEESATGTASCALACYLARHYEKKEQYIFEQGYNLGEISKIIVNLTYEQDEIDTVFVGGYGYLVCEKQLEV